MIVHVVIAAMVTVLGGGWDTADLQAPPGGRRLVPALSAPAARDPAGKSLQGHTAPLRENPPPVFKVQIPRLTPGTVFTNARVSRGITFRWPKLASDRLVWGGYRTAPPTGPPTLGYTGHVYDPNAGLVYGKARWYAPELGTWMSEDPVGALGRLLNPTGLGAWLYGNANPIMNIDPTGMDPVGQRAQGQGIGGTLESTDFTIDWGLLRDNASVKTITGQTAAIDLSSMRSDVSSPAVEVDNNIYSSKAEADQAVQASPLNRPGYAAYALYQTSGGVILPTKCTRNTPRLAAALDFVRADRTVQAREFQSTTLSLFVGLEGLRFTVKVSPPTGGVGEIWNLEPRLRGRIIEKMLGQNLPQNFPTIDSFSNGVATSIKSVNLGDKSYQAGSALERTLFNYVTKLSQFNGARLGGVTIRGADVVTRVLQVAIPNAGTAEQAAVLTQIADYARDVGVVVRYTEVP